MKKKMFSDQTSALQGNGHWADISLHFILFFYRGAINAVTSVQITFFWMENDSILFNFKIKINKSN
jgi:hypothetical protein